MGKLEQSSPLGAVRYAVDKDYGVYNLAGYEPRQLSPDETLSDKVVWLTNRPTVKQSERHFLPSSFFGVSTEQILSELGLDQRKETSKVYVSSWVAQLIFAHKSCWQNRKQMTAKTLAGQLSHIRGVPAMDRYTESLERGVIDTVKTGVYRENEDIEVTLYFPRYQHARRIMSVFVPQDNLEYVKSKLPAQKARLSWIQKQAPDALLKIKINKVSGEFNQLVNANFQTINPNLLNQGGWVYVTLAEAIWLSQLAKLEVGEANLSHERHQLPLLPVVSPLASLAYGYGIYCQNAWLSHCVNNRGQKLQTFTAMWLRAEDRLTCLKKACQLRATGYRIVSYGQGQITVSIALEEIKELVLDAYDLGLLAPARYLMGAILPQQDQELFLLAQLLASDNLKRLLKLDVDLLSQYGGQHAVSR